LPELELPQRYEALTLLGKGGGGEVWAVRDRRTGLKYALKVLAQNSSQPEMDALIREAMALSGLEGLGVPRVIRFGRLPGSQRPYLVRELVDGQSLDDQPAGTIFRLLNQKLGQNIRLRIRRGREERELDMTVKFVELANYRIVESQSPTAEQLKIRERWLKR